MVASDQIFDVMLRDFSRFAVEPSFGPRGRAEARLGH
jgi:hypothetical protein